MRQKCWLRTVFVYFMGKVKVISKEEAWEYAVRIENRLKITNSMRFSDCNYRAPEIGVFCDDVSFFDSSQNTIHIGTSGIVDMFSPENLEEFYNAILYVQGHEEQHRRSTATMPYARAISRGVKAVIDVLAKDVEGKPRRFRNDRDYEYYVNVELPAKGIYLSWNAVERTIAYLANSLEDGRIERIRSNRLPGFEQIRMIFRGKFWDQEAEYPTLKEINENAGIKLSVLLSQILSLATCQVYQKGFAKTFVGTPIKDEVDSFMGSIAGAVTAGKVRDMEPHVIALSTQLAPYIIECCKMSKSQIEAKEMLEKILEDVFKAIASSMPDGITLSERDEETDDGSVNSTFGKSDLVVEVDEETYDKLIKNSKPSKNGGGIMIRKKEESKEKTKEEKEENKAENKETKTDAAKGTSIPSDAEGENGSEKMEGTSSHEEVSAEAKDGKDSTFQEPSTSDDPSGSDGMMTSGGEGSEGDLDGHDGGGSSKEADAKADEGSPSGGAETKGKETEGSEETDREASCKNDALSTGGKIKGRDKADEHKESSKEALSDEDVIKAIRESVKTAKDLAEEEARALSSTVNEASGHEKKITGPVIEDTETAFSPKEARSVMGDPSYGFVEILRDYDVDANLPPVIQARGKALHRKNEKYFKSLSSPNIRNLASGGVDPSRLFGLAIGDTDVFRKKGRDKHFDGCAYILIDNSGSMHGGAKFREACAAAAIIEEGFKGLMSLKIASFSDFGGKVIHQRIKGWEESLRKNCTWAYYRHKRPSGGNADGCSIGVATRELQKRHERKKLLVVLSDGQPTEGSSNPIKLTKDKVAEARKLGISVVGIYFENGKIGSDAKIFKQIYGDNKYGICCRTDEIDKHLCDVFQTFARK